MYETVCEQKELWSPKTLTSSLLNRKWHLVIVYRLMEGGKSFNRLSRSIPEISDTVLSESLKDLQEKGIVHKEIISESPKKVEYSLTEKGDSLRPVILSMKRWEEQNSV